MWRRGTNGQNNTHTNIFTHPQIYFCPWQGVTKMPTYPPSFMLKKGTRSIVNAKNKIKNKVIPLSAGVVLAAHEIPPAEELSEIRTEAEHITAQRREAGKTFTHVGSNA